MGGITDLSAHEVARMTSQDGVPSFMIVAEIDGDGSEGIVGEAYCALDIADQQGEFAVSVRDRWQRRGIGFALLAAVESCADRFGLKGLFGETMQSNDRMKNLAVRAGFVVGRCPGDWSISRLEKRLQVASQMPDDPPAPGSAHSLLSRSSAAPCNPFKAV
jgi:GNAT superfamily N-acetyltransferase